MLSFDREGSTISIIPETQDEYKLLREAAKVRLGNAASSDRRIHPREAAMLIEFLSTSEPEPARLGTIEAKAPRQLKSIGRGLVEKIGLTADTTEQDMLSGLANQLFEEAEVALAVRGMPDSIDEDFS